MRRRKIDANVERSLLIAMIVSKEFLSQCVATLKREQVRGNPLFSLIVEWCLDYWGEYKDAPKAAIEPIYHTWADTKPDEALADDVHALLEELSGQYEENTDLNVKYLLDELGEFLTKQKLTRVQEELEAVLARGDTTAANSIINDYRQPAVGKSDIIDPLNDDKVWERALAQAAQPLIEFSGDAGRFLNRMMCRERFVVLQAPEKGGKSFWLMEFMFKALEQRRKVAMFQCGDLTEADTLMRIGVRLAGVPEHRDDCRKPVYEPIEIVRDEDEELSVKVTYDKHKFKSPLTISQVKVARKRFKRMTGLADKKANIRISSHASGTVNFAMIEEILDQWEHDDGFVPDVILTDYMDIMAAESKQKDEQAQINETWQTGRAVSMRRHVLLISATQANADAYGQKTQNMRNFSRDKRKLAHVSGMLGINQTDDEKEAQIVRLNWIVNRHARSISKKCLYVGSCLTLGRALCCATL